MRDRVVLGRPATLELTFYSDETATEPTSATIHIVASDGTDVVAAGTAVDLGAPADGIATYDLAAQASLDTLTATWTAVLSGNSVDFTQTIEIVGGHYFSISELRSQSGLDDAAVFSASLLVAARLATEDLFEKYTGVAWVNRFKRVTLDGSGKSTIRLPMLQPTAVTSLSIGGVAVADLSGVVVWPDGDVYYPGGFTAGRQNVVIGVEHGFDSPPEDLRRAAVRYARVVALDFKSRIPERAIQMNTEAGSFQLALASRERPTGYPEIDAILQQHDHRIPGIA